MMYLTYVCTPPNIPTIVDDLVKIGPRSFIFPKPVALTRDNLYWLLNMKKCFDLKIAVASQWHYAGITRVLRLCAERIKNETRKVEISFLDFQSDERLKNYTGASVFVPHLLQIIYSANIFDLNDSAKMSVEVFSPSLIVIRYKGSPSRPVIKMTSDTKSKRQERMVTVFSGKDDVPSIIANFLDNS